MLWGGNVALGRKFALGSCSGEAMLLWGGRSCSGVLLWGVLWGVTLGSCSGEMSVALGRQCCSGEMSVALGEMSVALGSEMLLWGDNVALGEWNLKCVKYIKTRRNL